MNGIRPPTATPPRGARTKTKSICVAIVAGLSLAIPAFFGGDSFGSVTAQDLPLPPGATRTRSGEQEETAPQERAAEKKPGETTGVLDLVDPSRTSDQAKQASAKREVDQQSANAVLRMTPGVGGNPLGGLSEEVIDQLSDDMRALLQVTDRSGQRAAIARASRPPQAGSAFPEMSTLGVPSWAEQPGRDQMGRITNLKDANGNRVSFEYGPKGHFSGMWAEPVGSYNTDRGPGGNAKPSVSLGRFGRYPSAFGNLYGYDRRFTHNRNAAKLPSYPFADTTVGTLQPNGGRTFATFDLLGREAYRYDSRGRLILNQYSPGGKRVGTFDEDGRMTLYGGDGARQTTAFTSSGGKVMATEHGSVLRTNDGAMINTTAPYYSGTSQNSQQRAEAFDTNPLRINPRPQTPPR